MSHSHSLLVTGIGGQLASEAVRHLLSHIPGSCVIGTTRHPRDAEPWSRLGVDVRLADFDQPKQLDSAFTDADRVLLVSTPTTPQPGLRMAQHRAAIAAMQAAGVQHVVYTSLMGVNDPRFAMAADHAATETLLQASGMTHTVVRDAFYMDLILARLPTAITTSRWITASGDARIAYVDRRDCARAAAACLLRPALDGRVVRATGPQALGAQDVVDIANAVLGTSMRVEHASAAELPERLVDCGMQPAMASVLASIDAAVAHGAMATVSADIVDICGMTTTRLEAFLVQHRGAISAQLGDA